MGRTWYGGERDTPEEKKINPILKFLSYFWMLMNDVVMVLVFRTLGLAFKVNFKPPGPPRPEVAAWSSG